MSEVQAVRTVVDYGKTYGFGNMIYRLRLAWMIELRRDGMSWESAMLGALFIRSEIKRMLKRVHTDEARFIKDCLDLIGM